MKEPRLFIPRGGEVAWSGPSAFANARLYGFAVKADKTLVHEMLTRYIGWPSQALGLHIDVCGTMFDRVFFIFLDSDRHQLPISGGKFEAGHHERLFAIVVLGHRRAPDPGLVLFAPYVYNSDTPGWRADREIYGYPQQRGDVDIDLDRDKLPSVLSVKAPAIERFGKNATAESRVILRIESKPGPALAAPIPNTIAEAMARTLEKSTNVTPHGPGAVPLVTHPRLGRSAADVSFFKRHCPGGAVPPGPDPEPGDLDNLIRVLMSGSTPMLFLKQFRDILYADRACYQAIVEARFKISGRAEKILTGNYQLTMEDSDSVPIRRELGIQKGDVPVDFAFLVELDELSVAGAHVISNPYWSPAVESSVADESSRLPRYVDRGGEAVWRQPSLLHGARIYGFGVPVPEQNQKALLDTYVNKVASDSKSTYGPETFELRTIPGLEFVMLLFVDYERITSGSDVDMHLGGSHYREFLVVQLALSADEAYPELDWFVPFIYLDTDSPRLAGREIFGYPKQLGTIGAFKRYHDGRSGLEPAKELEVSATVIHDVSQKRAELRSVVKIAGPEDAPAIKGRYLKVQPLVEALMKDAGPAAGAIENALVFAGLGNVFLKQFRDCAKPEYACYQAVCKTDTVPGRFRGAGCLDPSGYTITIENHASEPLLGLINGSRAPGPPAIISPIFAFWLDVDLELTSGSVIANPLEAEYAPDISGGRTPRGPAVPRMIRRFRQPEC
jgi:hypothetical protein